MAYRFDADTDYLTVSANLPTITSWTVIVRFKISVDLNDYGTIFKIGEALGGADTSYEIDIGSDGTSLSAYNGVTETSGSSLILGTYYDIAATCAGTGAGQFLVYLNAEVDITLAGNANIVMQELTVGRYHTTTAQLPVNGCVEDIMVYNRPFSQKEIKAQTRQRKPIEVAGLLHWLPCSDIGAVGVNYGGINNVWTVAGTLTQEQGSYVPWMMSDRRKAYYFTPAGVLTPLSLDSSVTPVSSLIKVGRKSIGSVVVPISTLNKRMNKGLSSAVVPITTVLRRTNKALASSITPTTTVVTRANKALTSTVVPVSDLSKKINKSLTSAVLVITSLSRFIAKGEFNSVVAPVTTVVKIIIKTLNSEVIPTTTFVTSVIRVLILSSAVTPVTNLVKVVNKVLSSSIPSASFMLKAVNKSLGSGVTPVSSVVKRISKAFSTQLK